jgi:hypothetical protein
MRKNLSLAIALEALILITVFAFTLNSPDDPDLGWHLRYGQYFWQTGHILTRNIFSSSLPNFYWVNPSWGFEVILYPLFKTFGFIGLSIWGAVTVTLAFLFMTITSKVKPWLKMLLLPPYLILGYGVVWGGMRTQLDSILGLAIVYFLVSKKKFIYLPFVFLIWANLHGGFILGLFIWFIFLAWRMILGFRNVKIRKELISESGIFAISILACLINPFTYQIFTEDLRHGTSTILRAYVTEWMPIHYGSLVLTLLYIYSGIVLLISASVLIKDWKKSFHYVLISLIFFYLTLDSRRYLIIYALSSLPIALIFFKQNQGRINIKFHKILNSIALIIILPIFFYALFIRLPSLNLMTFDWNSYCSVNLDISCSERLASFLNKNTPQGKGFNTYNLGGYLLWRVPKIKTFVDGRMVVWQDKGVYPMEDFVNIYYRDGWIQAFEKQKFNWAIVQSGKNLDNYLSSLTQSGQWKEEYRDDNAVYYVKLK